MGYSTYLVSKKVLIYTKHNDDDYYLWESLQGGSFAIERIQPVQNFGRGTRVVVYLKDDQLEFLEERRIRDIVKKHSEFISYPIALEVEKVIEKDIVVNDNKNPEEVDSSKTETKRVKEVKKELQVINKQRP